MNTDKFKGRTPSRAELLAEIERLRVCLIKANSQAEHFEREWHSRGDEIDRLRSGDVILFGVREIVSENVALRNRVAELEQLVTDAYLQADGGAL